MAASFETSDAGSSQFRRPLRVATRREHIFAAALEMAEDMKGWQLERADEEALQITCTKNGGALGGRSSITIVIEGSCEVPSTTVNCRCVTEGGLLGRPRAIVESYMKLLFRRIC